MDSYNALFDLFIGATGVYAIYQVFSKNSIIYNTDHIKKQYRKLYNKAMKWLCLADGILAIGMAVLDFLKIQPVAMITFVLVCISVVTTLVVNGYCTEHVRTL